MNYTDIRALHARIASLEDINARQSRALKAANVTLEDAEDHLRNYAAMEAELNRTRTHISSAERALHEKDEIIDRLSRENAELRRDSRADALERRLVETRRELAICREANHNLETTNRELLQRIDTNTTHMNNQRHNFASLNRELERYKNLYHEYAAAAARHADRVTQLEKDLAKARDTERLLRAHQADQFRQIQQKEATIVALREKLDEVRTPGPTAEEYDEMVALYGQMRDRARDLTRKLADANRKVKQTEGDWDELTQTIQRDRNEMKVQQAHINRLVAKLQNAYEELAALKSADSHYTQHLTEALKNERTQKKQASDEVDRLRRLLGETQRSRITPAVARQLREENEFLKKRVPQLEKEVTDLRCALTTERTKLRASADAYEEIMGGLRRQLETARKEMSNMRYENEKH